MRGNKLSPNPQKTEFAVIGHPLSTRKPEFPEIKRVERTKYQRVIIDESLNWDEQYKRVRSKINTGLEPKAGFQNRACCIIENAKIKDNWSRSWLNVENIIRYDRNIMA